MTITGKCYCGEIAYEAQSDVLMRVQCHCRECQYITGGSANLTMGVKEDGFTYTKGAPKQYKREDLDGPVTREFCGTCGTPLSTRAVPSTPGIVLLKVGGLDDPSQFDRPDVAIFLCDKQNYHLVDERVPSFDKLPG